MSTYWKNAVARANVFTGFAKLCVVVQSMKRLVKFGQVTVALITAQSYSVNTAAPCKSAVAAALILK